MNTKAHMSTAHIAIDLGADSGRVVLGIFDGQRFTLDVVHRFANTPITVGNLLRWDLASLWSGITTGLDAARQRALTIQVPILSLGVDTWGVDYGLLNEQHELLDPPVHYRAERNVAMPERVHQIIPKAELYARSGTRGLVFNTIFQVLAEMGERPELIAKASRLLTIPDLLAWRLCGVMANEWTNAGTTGLTRAGRPDWDVELMTRLGIPTRLFGPIVPSGTILGPVKAELGFRDCLAIPDRGAGESSGWLPVRRSEEMLEGSREQSDAADTADFRRIRPSGIARQSLSGSLPVVVAVGGHDTASAVAAMPIIGSGTAFISCGTWSLMGVLNPTPVTSNEAFVGELSNEIAVDGQIRLLKNIMGLWVWQECRRDLIAEGHEFSHAELAQLAEAAPAAPLAASGLTATIDIDRADLLGQSLPTDRMIDRVRRQATALGLEADEPGALFRRIVEGLAAAYQHTRLALERATGTPITGLSLMGGGCRNRLLCQLTANATGLPVLAGPDEGTALGNLLVQARGLGLLSATTMAQVSAASSQVQTYLPAGMAAHTAPA